MADLTSAFERRIDCSTWVRSSLGGGEVPFRLCGIGEKTAERLAIDAFAFKFRVSLPVGGRFQGQGGPRVQMVQASLFQAQHRRLFRQVPVFKQAVDRWAQHVVEVVDRRILQQAIDRGICQSGVDAAQAGHQIGDEAGADAGTTAPVIEC